MPTYIIVNKQTGEETKEFMSLAEYEQYKIDNPHLEQAVCAPGIVSGISTRLKPDKGFREILGEIKKKNPKAKINDFGG